MTLKAELEMYPWHKILNKLKEREGETWVPALFFCPMEGQIVSVQPEYQTPGAVVVYHERYPGSFIHSTYDLVYKISVT